MSEKLIDKVHSIVIDNISDEKFGVHKLASQLELSLPQTLRKIKTATGKSVNQYIREIRLEKAAELIATSDFTMAEISYKVGFGSPSYFNKAFHKYYGISPGESKAQNISLIELEARKAKNKSHSIFSNRQLWYVSSIALVFVIGFLLINKATSTNTSFPKSIAVLPFKDTSPVDTQWFCDGISDNILHLLSQIEGLTVISFTSSSTYRGTDKQIPEIAKELGVSYILEGSVTLYEDTIRITTQLINANDEHVWSKEYTESFENVIAIQKNVAQEVMKQMEITLSSKEEIALKKYPTENMEAYNLHLKGRLINDSRKVEDLELNIELNKQAIALDSSFSEAYAEIAHSYYLLGATPYYLSYDARNYSNYYADMAIKIDPNSYKAWAVKGSLLGHKDWDKAKECYEKAIALNPNDALVHIQYAQYYLYRQNPDIKKYLEHLTIAQRLNPLSNALVSDYLQALILNDKFKEAEAYLDRMGFLLSEKSKVNYQCRIIAYKNKDWTTIFPFLKSKIDENPNNSIYYSLLGLAYDGILNDDIKATEYHKKAYELDSTNFNNIESYSWLLSESKKSKEAKQLRESANYKSIFSEMNQKVHLWYYYYHQENYKKALEISKDSLLINRYGAQAWTHAQLGNKKKVDSINKKIFWGGGNDRYWRCWRAFTHAILKNKDSMYYYLETARYDGSIKRYQNSRREFDPYRNEERYKAILRANYLPVPGE